MVLSILLVAQDISIPGWLVAIIAASTVTFILGNVSQAIWKKREKKEDKEKEKAKEFKNLKNEMAGKVDISFCGKAQEQIAGDIKAINNQLTNHLSDVHTTVGKIFDATKRTEGAVEEQKKSVEEIGKKVNCLDGKVQILTKIVKKNNGG